MSLEPEQEILGLFELDDVGTILYSSLDHDGSITRAPSLLGANFFADVTNFTNVNDFRSRFNFFCKTELLSHSFDFTCVYSSGPSVVRVSMARFDRTPSASFLVHLRRP